MSRIARETYLVIGLGKTGVACAQVLTERGVQVIATDEKPVAQLAEPIDRIRQPGARYVAPQALSGELLATVTQAVLSPGIPLTSAVVRLVRDAGVPIVGEIELAYRIARAPIVAVTGTKGKSTVTALIGHLLAATGKSVRVGGNIGNPLVREVVSAGASDWVIAEVSSFQLETVERFKPRVAVLLNVSPDHLDRYPTMDEYAAAKFRIFACQDEADWFVGNLDDPRVAALRDANPPRLRAKQLWYALSAGPGANVYCEKDAIFYSDGKAPVELARLAGVPLLGQHNVRNAMAALCAAIAAGCEPLALREPLASFRAMPHRLEPVAEIDGVLYVDDSKATNPASTIAALRAYRRPVVLIAGGRSKGTSFVELGAEIRSRVKRLIVIGEAADRIAADAGSPALHADSIDEAVSLAKDAARSGDVVLLSPACASLDMFDSAEDRGARFARAVQTLRVSARA